MKMTTITTPLFLKTVLVSYHGDQTGGCLGMPNAKDLFGYDGMLTNIRWKITFYSN